MLSKLSFKCPFCEEKYQITGHWYNQVIAGHYLHYKYFLHLFHTHKQRGVIRTLVIYTLAWIPLLLLQALEIIIEPFRRLF